MASGTHGIHAQEDVCTSDSGADTSPTLVREDLISPSKVAIYGVLFYVAVFILAPLEISVDFSVGGALFLAVSYLAFFAGCFFQRMFVSRSVPKPPRQTNYDGLFKFSLAVSIVGIGLRAYDRFVARGVILASDLLARREALEMSGASGLSAVGGMLFPFAYISLFLYFLVAKHGKPNPFYLPLSLLVFLYPAVEALAIGNRGAVLTSSALLLLYLYYFKKLNLNKRSLAVMIPVILLGLVFFSSIFQDRLSAMGLDVSFSIFESAYAFTLKPEPWFAELLRTTSSPAIYQILFSLLHAAQYITHGVFEFFYLYDHFDSGYDHTWGAVTFYVYYKMIGFIGGFPVSEDILIAAQPRSGIYTTFCGPLFVDFGWLGTIVVFWFGVVMQSLWRAARMRDTAAAPIYLYLLIAVFFMPVVNLVSNALGLYVITAFVVFFIVQRAFFTNSPTAQG